MRTWAPLTRILKDICFGIPLALLILLFPSVRRLLSDCMRSSK